jgi:hypothetical protein
MCGDSISIFEIFTSTLPLPSSQIDFAIECVKASYWVLFSHTSWIRLSRLYQLPQAWTVAGYWKSRFIACGMISDAKLKVYNIVPDFRQPYFKLNHRFSVSFAFFIRQSNHSQKPLRRWNGYNAILRRWIIGWTISINLMWTCVSRHGNNVFDVVPANHTVKSKVPAWKDQTIWLPTFASPIMTDVERMNETLIRWLM